VAPVHHVTAPLFNASSIGMSRAQVFRIQIKLLAVSGQIQGDVPDGWEAL